MSSPAHIGITLGDPSGIGPEIVSRLIGELDEATLSRVVVFGDRVALEKGCALTNVTLPTTVRLIESGVLEAEGPCFGKPDKSSARAQLSYLEAAVAAAREASIGALVTAPISKEWAQRAGFAFPGHTEYLAHELGVDEVAMMFAGPTLKVVLATVHEALATVPSNLTVKRVRTAIRRAAQAMQQHFGVERPRIGVLALNPHAGEGGRFGREEIDVIVPAIEASREELGTSAELIGPLVPDAAYRVHCDVFVAMYHDQALIPVKLLDFERAANLTLGLPVIRCSPDHGVAYDIAGTGKARVGSLRAAFALALQLLDSSLARASRL